MLNIQAQSGIKVDVPALAGRWNCRPRIADLYHLTSGLIVSYGSKLLVWNTQLLIDGYSISSF